MVRRIVSVKLENNSTVYMFIVDTWRGGASESNETSSRDGMKHKLYNFISIGIKINVNFVETSNGT